MCFQDLISLLSILATTFPWMLLIASCCKSKKPKEPASGGKKPGVQPDNDKKPGPAAPPAAAPPANAPAPGDAGASPAADNPDPIDEGGDNYEDVNIGGGEPPPPA
uniref:Uncharacterized protein n=1 Tax=Ascaris lumbricoides TaxID=6252 RepID=A0A0M3I7M3_ASCLU